MNTLTSSINIGPAIKNLILDYVNLQLKWIIKVQHQLKLDHSKRGQLDIM